MNDVIINKAEIIENCIKRALEEYNKDPDTINDDYTRQDALILNIQRACQAAIDLATHIVRIRKLGIPQTSRDVFELLESADIINENLSNKLQKMVGFRNIAIHIYQDLNLDIIHSVVKHHLDDLLEFKTLILKLS